MESGGGGVDGEALLVIEFRKEISVVQEFIFEELFPWLFPGYIIIQPSSPLPPKLCPLGLL